MKFSTVFLSTLAFFAKHVYCEDGDDADEADDAEGEGGGLLC